MDKANWKHIADLVGLSVGVVVITLMIVLADAHYAAQGV